MKIYGSYTSPFVRHCRILLSELQRCAKDKARAAIDCEFIETDLKASTTLSPTQKVPYLVDGDLILSDSSSIIKHLREISGQRFMSDIREYDLFCMVNTILDATVNVFFIERIDGLKPCDSQYLQRHQNRVASALAEINQRTLPTTLPLGDGHIRLACYLDWALFRDRISLTGLNNLAAFLTRARAWDIFASTAPPQGA